MPETRADPRRSSGAARRSRIPPLSSKEKRVWRLTLGPFNLMLARYRLRAAGLRTLRDLEGAPGGGRNGLAATSRRAFCAVTTLRTLRRATSPSEVEGSADLGRAACTVDAICSDARSRSC